MSTRAIALYSGGLDSLLAAAIIKNQGIEVIGLYCILPSVDPELNPDTLKASQLAKQINLPLVFYRCDDEYTQIVAHPTHGYGKNANPCIDCKIFFLQKAKEYMHTLNASFVITGEVVGQRPMSQYKSMLIHMEKESGLEGLILRPLSAKLLSPTIPEMEGIVDREKLYAISGRSREAQFELAKKFGITQFQSPAGGCFLTTPQIASRVKDLIAHPPFSSLDLFLANVGRHYRLHDTVKIIVARNQKECSILERYKQSADFFLEPAFKGPVIYGKGIITPRDYPVLGQILARYGKPLPGENSVAIFVKGNHSITIVAHNPIDDSTLSRMRI